MPGSELSSADYADFPILLTRVLANPFQVNLRNLRNLRMAFLVF